MSTRSGKRLHASLHDSPVEDTQVVLRSERKVRSKKQKVNVEALGNKRSNYVTYPADDDAASVSSGTTETQEKPKRRTRRNTLKEHNYDEPVIDDIVNNNENKKNVVKTRRGKTVLNVDERAIEEGNDENTEALVEKPTGKKKNRKKKNSKKTAMDPTDKLEIELVIPKKKGGKKKKKSSFSTDQQGDQNGATVQNMSADSFHSATDSPVNGRFTDNSKTNDNLSVNSLKLEGKEDLNATFDKTEVASNITQIKFTEDKDKTNVSVNFETTEDTDNPNATFNKSSDVSVVLNTTVAKEIKKKRTSIAKNSIVDTPEDIFENETKNLNATFDKDDAVLQNSTFDTEISKRRLSNNKKISVDSTKKLNQSFDRKSKSWISKTKSDMLNEDTNSNEMNITFDTEKMNICKSENDSKKSSLISSDVTINVIYDKSNDNSRISITSDESKTENILNFTPVLIESSVDETQISENNKTPDKPEIQAPLTPLKREGTFTKDGPDIVSSPKVSTDKTPVKRKSLPSPGRTPFPLSKSAQKEKSVLNVTRSIEKSLRRSSLGDIGPKQAKVMFCSPVNNPAIVTQIKGRVIKSNLKGSNKSFVFDNSVSSEVRPMGRKRSLTHGEAETRAKRKRLADDLQHSVDRLSRPRTVSATAKLPDPGTPSKKPTTPSKARPARTKLPNFAALHQKQFAKMESLDECQLRRAKRARHLLTPTGSVAIVERISPKGTPPKSAPPTKEPTTKLHTPSKSKLPTLESLNPGYTRFGFKLDVGVNPFSETAKKPVIKIPEEKRAYGLSRQTTCLALPSLAGATATRRDIAKQSVMREKSFTEKRDVKRKENRTIIKGVRTNRRFELQMKLRNVNS